MVDSPKNRYIQPYFGTKYLLCQMLPNTHLTWTAAAATDAAWIGSIPSFHYQVKVLRMKHTHTDFVLKNILACNLL